VTSQDVNAYLKEITGEDFTAKDFRTWAGTVLAATALREFDAPTSMTHGKKNVVQAIEAVAGILGNTPAVCRKSYIHPVVVEGYMDGWLGDVMPRRVNGRKFASKLRPDEVITLAILQQRISKDSRRKKAA
jgi:DNA topoisomerase-1